MFRINWLNENLLNAFWILRSSTFHFRTAHFMNSGLFTFWFQDRSLFDFRTVNFLTSGPFAFRFQDRILFDVKSVYIFMISGRFTFWFGDYTLFDFRTVYFLFRDCPIFDFGIVHSLISGPFIFADHPVWVRIHQFFFNPHEPSILRI